MSARRRCSPSPRTRHNIDTREPLDYLGPDGPLHPDLTPLRTADDACEAIDLSRPAAFSEGLLVLLLDGTARPYLAVAVDDAPDDDIDQVATLLLGARELGHPIGGVVLGVYRQERTDGSATIKMTDRRSPTRCVAVTLPPAPGPGQLSRRLAALSARPGHV